jgi:hypothetical protein
MEYRTFGRTGIKISVLGFGCMRLPVTGRDVNRIDEKEATEMIRHAIDLGVNYFDTAYTYHSEHVSRPGSSEPFLAKALRGGYRERVYLATKLPSWLVSSRNDMDRFLDEQLARLDTGTIDFYLLHSLNRSSWDIPRNFTLCNDHHMLNDRGAKTRYFRLLKESQRASGCIRCGECLEKCPQQIPIPDELEHVAELFES